MPAKHSPNLHGLDPRDLLMRGMASAGPPAGGWTPPGVEEIAQLFPGYEIMALLGRGGMGAVYRARQPSLDRLVAIKLLPIEISVDEEVAARFRREAHALARLQHPHIIAVHEFGTTSEGHLFFVMEYVDGMDLARLLRSGRLDVPRALGIVRQVCDALEYAHEHGVIHRDIKPANVLVSAAGQVKVGDFGLAKLTQADDAPAETRADTVLGTPGYTAPEQWRGRADHRADIYSLGVMFYEMLTGEVPQGVFDPPSKKAHTDARLDPVVLRAMQEEPDRRYQQAGELRDDVDRVGGRRPRTRIIIIAAAAVAALGTVAWWKAQPPATGTFTPPPPVVWTNSLGMKFIPLGVSGVQMCIWETRVRDFEEFAKGTDYVAPPGLRTIEAGKYKQTSRTWRDPGFPQTPDDPVCGTDWATAQAFCRWLTETERAAGLLPGAEARYRLPTDAEWSQACGISESPAEASAATTGRYPWGAAWPPPPNAGNYAGKEVLDAAWPSDRSTVPGFRDGFRATSPVGSFPANALGFHDLGGNVWEWCEAGPTGDPGHRWMRGASWFSASPRILDAGYRSLSPHDDRSSAVGFRIVLAPR